MLTSLPGDPTRVLVAGDTHGNLLHWEHVLLPAARAHQVDGIVQLGDFGYWPLTTDGRDYLAALERQLHDDGRWVVFIDGNHEDHLALRQCSPRADGFVPITPHILWAPRAHRWTWQGVRFLALGGAYSIDRRDRTLNSGRWGWFAEETITAEQAAAATVDGPADVLLVHDAPRGAIPQVLWAPRYAPSTLESARHVQAVAEATQPALLLHGHWHQFQQVPLPGQDTEVIGLSYDGTLRSWLVLDLPGLAVTHAPTDGVGIG